MKKWGVTNGLRQKPGQCVQVHEIMDGISNKPGILDQKIYRILPDRITIEMLMIW